MPEPPSGKIRPPGRAAKALGRSRKRADKIARRILNSKTVLCDEHVLRVLGAWKFNRNTSRKNVLPRGRAFVYSDTLGLVATRTGKVMVTKSARAYSNVFALLRSWLRCHEPVGSWRGRFPFTSINVNFDYAGVVHRDSNNAGPSVTKSFGKFKNGRLQYYGNDDVTLTPAELAASGARPEIVDTEANMLLFDGGRAHGVTSPVEGLRYSLVFFTAPYYRRVGLDVANTLQELGCSPLPTPETLSHVAGLLAPAKGYDLHRPGRAQPSIKRAFYRLNNHEDEQCYLLAPKAAFQMLPVGVLDVCLSFVVQPQAMSTLCACSRALDQAMWRQTAWAGTIVDLPWRAKPAGLRAFMHFHMWSRPCLGVSTMGWMFTSCSFLLNGSLIAWEWSRSPSSDGEWHECRGHRLLISRNRIPPNDVNLRLHLPHDGPKEVVVAVASTDSAPEIMAAILDRRTKQTRGPPPQTEMTVRAFWVRLCTEPAARTKTFFANGKACKSDCQLPPLADFNSRLITLGVGADCIRTCIHGKVAGKAYTREASSFSDNVFRVAVIVKGKEKPELRARPFLNRTRAEA